MRKGFLLIDQSMNTVIVDNHDPDLVEFFRPKPNYVSMTDRINQHRTQKDLLDDVRNYVKGIYKENNEK